MVSDQRANVAGSTSEGYSTLSVGPFSASAVFIDDRRKNMLHSFLSDTQAVFEAVGFTVLTEPHGNPSVHKC